MKQYQIIAMDRKTGKWAFLAHGARWLESEAIAMRETMQSRGERVRLLLCGKESG